MWSDIGAVVLFIAIIVMMLWGGSWMYRSTVRGRYTAQGEDIEELMFRADRDRRLDQEAGIPVPPRWWQRILHHSGRGGLLR